MALHEKEKLRLAVVNDAWGRVGGPAGRRLRVAASPSFRFSASLVARARGLESRLDLHLEPVTHPRRERRAGEAPRRVANVGDVTFRFFLLIVGTNVPSYIYIIYSNLRIRGITQQSRLSGPGRVGVRR